MMRKPELPAQVTAIPGRERRCPEERERFVHGLAGPYLPDDEPPARMTKPAEKRLASGRPELGRTGDACPRNTRFNRKEDGSGGWEHEEPVVSKGEEGSRRHRLR